MIQLLRSGVQVMMAHERCAEEDAEAILSNLKMEGRCSSTEVARVLFLLLYFQIIECCRSEASFRLHRRSLVVSLTLEAS